MRLLYFFPILALLCGCSKPQETAPPVAAQTPQGTPPQQLQPATDTRPVVVCFGDSLTAGLGVESGQTYPDLLQKELDGRGYRYRVVNLGVSGDTTQDGLERLPLVLSEKPRIVLVEFGANDGLRGQPPPITEQNLSQIIEALQKAGVQVELAGITLPPNYGPEYIRKFDAIYPELASRYKVPLLPFLLAGVAGKTDLMQRDGLHPNAEGTRLVARNVFRALEPLLKRE
jgi:acyl-CoA thioesterase-1